MRDERGGGGGHLIELLMALVLVGFLAFFVVTLMMQVTDWAEGQADQIQRKIDDYAREIERTRAPLDYEAPRPKTCNSWATVSSSVPSSSASHATRRPSPTRASSASQRVRSSTCG